MIYLRTFAFLALFFVITPFSQAASVITKTSTHHTYEEVKETRNEACQRFIEEVARPLGYGFDWIDVNEDPWNVETSHQIKVFYFWKNTNSQRILNFYPGGPGTGMSKEMLQNPMGIEAMFSQITGGSSFVFIDQRGNGCSDALPPIDSGNVARYRYYLSRGIAEDSEAVRRDLIGTSQWIVFGQSFGSMIVQRYIALHPEGITAAFAHGYSAVNDSQVLAKIRITAHRRTLGEYFRAYPDDVEKLRLIRQFLMDHEYRSEHFTTHGPFSLDAMGLMVGVKADWENIHASISSAFDSNGQVSGSAVDQLINTYVGDTFGYGTPIDVLNVIYNRFEAYIPTETSLRAFYRRLISEINEETGHTDDVEQWLLGEEARSELGVERSFTSLVDSAPLGGTDPLTPSMVKAGMLRNSNLRFYLYSAGLDTFSPPEVFQPMRDELGAEPSVAQRFSYLNQPGMGHEGFLDMSVISKILDEMSRPVQ